MNTHIDIQHASILTAPIDDETLMSWVKLTLAHENKVAELTLRIINTDEMQCLNKTYRQQDKTTNVLSFPSNLPADVQLETAFLGDILICPQVLLEESIQFSKPLTAHWAHITIHGVLHLLGYDHIDDDDAQIMQNLEILLLTQLNIDNPYEHWGDEIA